VESEDCDTGQCPIPPTASPTTFANWEEQHILPIRIKEKEKADSDWSVSFGKRSMEMTSRLVSARADFKEKVNRQVFSLAP
jgi:hypothetical protein